MHRFRLILLPLCLFATATAIGQTVTGRIVDERQQPVAGVAVVMQTPDSVYVDAVASDLEGRFAIASDVRPYRLLFQHLSYNPLTVERSGDDAGTVTLTEATNLVDEVVVRGERPLVKVEQGRLSYDLQVAAQGKIAANAYEALTKLPGVSERDGALTLARRRRCDGHPQRKTLDDDGRTARRTAQIDPGRAGGEGRGALRRTAAVPHPRRGDQRRASPPFRPLVLRPGQRHLRGRLLPLVGNGSERRLFDADTLGRRALPRRRSPFDAQTAADLAAHGRQRHVRHPAGAAPCRRQPHAQPPHGAFVENLRKKPYRPGLHRIVHPVGQRRHLGHGQLRRKRLAYPRRRGDAQPRALRLHGFRNADRGRLHALQHHQPAGDVAPARPTAHLRRSAPTPDSASTASRSRSTRATTSAGSGHSTTAPASSMSATTTTSIIRRKRR